MRHSLCPLFALQEFRVLVDVADNFKLLLCPVMQPSDMMAVRILSKISATVIYHFPISLIGIFIIIWHRSKNIPLVNLVAIFIEKSCELHEVISFIFTLIIFKQFCERRKHYNFLIHVIPRPKLVNSIIHAYPLFLLSYGNLYKA